MFHPLPLNFFALTLFSLLSTSVSISFASATTEIEPGVEPGVESGTFTQKLDHFRKNTQTFSQRFFTYDSSAGTKTPLPVDAPVFFMLGNEGPVTEKFLTATVMKLLADQLGGRAVILEHRFYGGSIPGNDLSNQNLKFLTTDQILEDFADFQRSITAKKGWRGPWVSIGSSYAGNLSAYYRLKFPTLVKGAVVSSAPLETPFISSKMNQFASSLLPPKCLDSFSQQLAYIEEVLLKDPIQRANLLMDLKGEKIRDNRSVIQAFSSELAGLMQTGRIAPICEAMVVDPTEARSLIAIFKKLMANDKGLFEISLEKTFDLTSQDNLYRSWFYQTCTEYGFFDKHDPIAQGPQIFPASLDENYYRMICQKAYGVNLETKPNAELGMFREQMLHLKNLNMLLLNGNRDPWSIYSIKEGDPSRGIFVKNVDGFHGVGISGNTLVDPSVNPLKRSVQDLMILMLRQWIQKK